MPRLPRISLPNLLYLVTARGDERQPLFKDAEDYQTYLSLLMQYKQRHAVKVFAYCLMPDQVQLCIELESGANISGFMHDVTTQYTKHANRRYNRSGHLFLERFRTVLIEKRAYLLPVTAFVHSAPSRAGLARDFTAYPHSSYPHYATFDAQGRDGELSGEIGEALRLLPQGAHDYAGYLSSVEAKAMEQLGEELQSRIVGSEAFVAEIRARLNDKALKPAHVETAARAKRSPLQRLRLRAPHVAWLGGAAAAVLVVSMLGYRSIVLERTVVSLARENESAFQARFSLAPRHARTGGPEQLAGTEWEIRLMSTGDSSDSALQRDQLTFTRNQQLSSREFALRGFPSTGFRLSSPRLDGTVVWEAVQSGPGGEILTWRGEWRGNTMRGAVTRQKHGESVRTSTFVGLARRTAGEPERQI